MVLQLKDWEEYTSDNILHRLNIWGFPDMLHYTRVLIPKDWYVNDIPKAIKLLDARVDRYQNGENEVIDTVLAAIWFKLIKIVDDFWEEIIKLKK